MARIIEYSTGKFKIETEVPTVGIHHLHIKDERVGMFNIGTKKYANGEMELFSDWRDETDTPYASFNDLITDLELKFPFFFDVDGPALYTEVNTFADLPPAASVTGQTYHVISATGVWLLGTRRQAGLYRSNGVDWILRNDISSLLVDSEFNIRDDVDNTKGIRLVLDALTSGFLRALTPQDKDYVIGDHADAIGSVTVHNDVSDAGSGQIITAQERTDINATIDVHSDVDYTGVTIANEFVLKRSGANWIPTLKAIVRSSALVINNTNVLTTKINQNIDVQRLVPHKITIGYGWSLNDGAQDLVAVASFGGIDLMTALTDNTEIHRQEPKDTGGADPDGRGTNQRHRFTGSFYVTPVSLGNNALILQFAGSAGGDLASMWEAEIEVEELVSVIGS